MAFIFTSLDNKRGYHQKLLQIAQSHCHKGVKAIEYGITGEVMFWTLRRVLGPKVYTDKCEQSWMKIYSDLLRVIIPVAVAHELANNEAQKHSLYDHRSSFVCSDKQSNCPFATSAPVKPLEEHVRANSGEETDCDSHDQDENHNEKM